MTRIKTLLNRSKFNQKINGEISITIRIPHINFGDYTFKCNVALKFTLGNFNCIDVCIVLAAVLLATQRFQMH